MNKERAILDLGTMCQYAVAAAAAIARGDDRSALEALYFVGVNYRCGYRTAGYTERQIDLAGARWSAEFDRTHPSGYFSCPGCGETRCDGSCVEPALEEGRP